MSKPKLYSTHVLFEEPRQKLTQNYRGQVAFLGTLQHELDLCVPRIKAE